MKVTRENKIATMVIELDNPIKDQVNRQNQKLR